MSNTVIQKTSTNLNYLINNILIKIPISKNILLEKIYDEKLIPFMVDKTTLENVFTNLFSKLVDSMKNKGMIFVKTEKNMNNVYIHLINTDDNHKTEDSSNILNDDYINTLNQTLKDKDIQIVRKSIEKVGNHFIIELNIAKN